MCGSGGNVWPCVAVWQCVAVVAMCGTGGHVRQWWQWWPCMALMTVCAWQCSGVWSDDGTDGRGERERNPVHALSDMHRITTLTETTQQIPPCFSQDYFECPSFLDGCCISTDNRINTDKQVL